MATEQKNGIIYGLNDRPPFVESVFAALQHLFAIFVAIMTPPLIIASQMQLDIETTSFLVSMALFASGVSTFIQCRKFGDVGTGLLCIQGTSYSFIGPIIAAGMGGGLAVVFGSCGGIGSGGVRGQHTEICTQDHHPIGVWNCGHADWSLSYKGGDIVVWRRQCGDGKRYVWRSAQSRTRGSGTCHNRVFQ